MLMTMYWASWNLACPGQRGLRRCWRAASGPSASAASAPPAVIAPTSPTRTRAAAVRLLMPSSLHPGRQRRDGRADEAVARDEVELLGLRQRLRALGMLRHHEVAGLGAGVPHADLGRVGQDEPELGEHPARVAHHPRPVGLA